MTGLQTLDDEGDVGVLRTWRAMCPALQERWPEAARPEQWRGVTMDDGRVVKLLSGGLWPDRSGAGGDRAASRR